MLTLWFAFIIAFESQESVKPLPDAESLRIALPGIIKTLQSSLFRAAMHADFLPEAAEYTYTEKETITTQGPGEGQAKVQVNVYDMMRGPEPWNYYRKQISRDGSSLTDRETQSQDRQHQTFEDRVRAAQSISDSRSDSTKRQEEARSALQKQAYDNDLRAMFDISVLGRERIEGVPVILLELNARGNYRPRTDYGKNWQRLTTRVWITEDSHEVVRLTAKLGEVYMPGGFAVIERDATLSVERRMINGEVWLPVRTEITGRRDRADGRTLGPREHVIAEFSSFKKFTVESVIRPVDAVQ